MCHDIDACNVDGSLRRNGARGRDGDRRGLARAVWPEEAVKLPRRNLQVNARDGGHRRLAGIHLAQTTYVDYRLGHASLVPMQNAMDIDGKSGLRDAWANQGVTVK